MKIWQSFKKIHDKIFIWLIPKEILLNYGGELRLQAKVFTTFALLCFFAGLPNVFYMTFRFYDVVGLKLLLGFTTIFVFPFLFYQWHKNLKLSMASFVAIAFLFLNGLYLFFDRVNSPILNWNLMLLYFTIVAIDGKIKNKLLIFQIIFAIIAIVVKFKFGESFQILPNTKQVDLGRVIFNLIFTSGCTYYLTNSFLEIQILGQEQKSINEHTNLLDSRLRATQSLASGLAHEINNPLTVLYGNLDRLERAISNPESLKDAQERLAQVIKAANRIQQIVKRLNSWTNFEYGNTMRNGKVDIDSIVQRALKDKKERIMEQNINLQLHIKNQNVPFHLSLIEFVLEELIENAIEFADTTPELQEGGAQVFVKVDFDFGWCNIQVGNTGKEINPEEEEQIFDPFYSRKEDGQAKGMGLSVAYSIVTRLNGKLAVKREGPFTVFSIHIPLVINESSGGKAA